MLAMQCSYEIAMQYMRWRDYVSERCLTALAVGVRELYELAKLCEQAKLAQQEH